MSKLKFAALLMCGLLTREAAAQATVQQPSFGVFSGGTTVSVPDRGGARIGSVGRAGSANARYGIGPLRPTTTGIFNESSGLNVHVRIHDFEEMDRQALGAAGCGSRRDGTQLSRRAEAAYGVLQDRAKRVNFPPSATRDTADEKESDPNLAESARLAREQFERGRKAEGAGNVQVALVYFRLAEKRGSADAREAIARLQGAGPKSKAATELSSRAKGDAR